MTLSTLIAVAYTFTTTATGVEKGTPLEFMFAGKGTDRDYETMFVLEGSVSSLCKGLEQAGIPRGRPVDVEKCRLWPVGCKLTISPKISDFVESDMPADVPLGALIYAGGSRDEKGVPTAHAEMPLAALSFYTLPQSPILFDGLYEQGFAYNRHKAKKQLKKGEKVTFTISWDGSPAPRQFIETVKPGMAADVMKKLKSESAKGDLDVFVTFADDLTVKEATSVAQALAVLDSVRIRINGRPRDGFFYRAFLPLVKWRDRKERLTQPFEVTIAEPDRVVFIDEDWSGEGLDPKLSEKKFSYAEMKSKPKTDTVFFYATSTTTIGRLKESLKEVPDTVRNHYVYWE